MRQYVELLEKILKHGTVKTDRTGTGTRSIFGHQMRFDLAAGFPLVTTKKMFFRGIVEELLWFISGSTNYKDLPESVQKWWSPWADDNGNLGPIYGEQLRSSRWFSLVEPLLFEPPELPSFHDGLFLGIGDLGSYRLKTGPGGPGEHPSITMLKNTWRDMLKRCYDKTSKGYKSYGEIGVHVDPSWLLFDNFVADAKTLTNWRLKLEYPDDYSLDKDIIAAANRYSKATCMWASHNEQNWNTSTGAPFSAVSPNGTEEFFISIGNMCRRHGTNLSAVHRCLHKKLLTHHGWSEFKYLDNEGMVFRFRELDQLRLVVSEIKHSPDSRRLVINLWDGPAMQHTKLPCCHGSVIQFYVCDGKLSCQMYQRSADVLIGVPVNIASYALLTMMVAQVTNLQLGEFVHTLGDAHLYLNHVEQTNIQISRDPRPLPIMQLNPEVKSIFDFKYEDFNLNGYSPHPRIQADISV